MHGDDIVNTFAQLNHAGGEFLRPTLAQRIPSSTLPNTLTTRLVASDSLRGLVRLSRPWIVTLRS